MRARASLSKARKKPVRVSAERHNEVLAAAQARVDALEGRLARVVEGVIDRAGARAAHRFALKATNHLTAAAGNANVSASSTMICLRPRPDEAEAIADPDGDAPETLHVTLAYLGKTDQPLAEIAEALRPVAASLAPLEGAVGGYGIFDPPGVGILLPDVRGLVELRVAVTEALLEARIDYGRQHGFRAHLTVAKDPSWETSNVGEGNYAEDDARGAGSSVTAGGAAGRGVSDLRSEPVEAALGPSEGRWAHDLRAPGRLDLSAWVGRPYAASTSPLRERPLSERGAHGAADELGAWEGDESEKGDLLGTRNAVRAEELSRARGLSGVFERGDGAPSGEEAGGVYPASTCGQPLHFDAIYVVRGNAEEVVIPLVGVPSLTAAGEPPAWSAPFPDEVIDVQKLVDELLAKTEPVRKAMIEQTMTPALEQAGLSWDVTNPLTAKVLAQSASQITSIAETTQLNVMRIVQSAYQNGLTIPQTATAIRAGMKVASASRATLIARTELAGAANGGSLAATQLVAGATGESYSKSWRTAPGAKYPRHEDYPDLDGQTVALDGVFQVGDDQLQFPGDPDGDPGEVCNCVPGETLVQTPSLRAATKRWYEGDLVRVHLASGDELAATPNHPVLRSDGTWTPIGSVEEGDHLVGATLVGRDVRAPDPDRPPAAISEIHRLAEVARDPERVRLAPPDFHGDGGDGEVDVVAINGSLLVDCEAASDEQVAEFGLALAYAARAGACGREMATLGDWWGSHLTAGLATTGIVRGLREGATLVCAKTGHPQLASSAAGADDEAEFLQAPHDCWTADPNGSADGENAVSAVVSVAEVIEIEVAPFHGYVYNLDTGVGWYTAGSLVCGNCRCTLSYGTPISTGEAAPSEPMTNQDVTSGVTGVAASEIPQVKVPWPEAEVVTADLRKAARELAAGKNVLLKHGANVSTFVDDLGKLAAEAQKAGKVAPDLNLAKVSVQGTNLFAQDSLGVPRIDMPQLVGIPTPGSPASKLPTTIFDGQVSQWRDISQPFFQSLRDQGISVTAEQINPELLRATQDELNGAKVAHLMDQIEAGTAPTDEPVIISSDNYILDGHHRWAASVGADFKTGVDIPTAINIERIDEPISTLLQQARQYSADMGIPPQSAFTTEAATAVTPAAPIVPDLPKVAAGIQPVARSIDIGITPFRAGEDNAVGFYSSAKYQQFERDLRESASSYGVHVDSVEKVTGVWEGDTEPSVSLRVSDTLPEPSSDAYKIQHSAPTPDFGAPMSDLTANDSAIYPADVYDKSTQMRFYGTNVSNNLGPAYQNFSQESFDVINRVKGDPNAMVTIYRAVPGNVDTINPGDWVTPSKGYAEWHSESALGTQEGGHVISMQVPASQLWTNGDAIEEWGWVPPNFEQISAEQRFRAYAANLAQAYNQDGVLLFTPDSARAAGPKTLDELRALHPQVEFHLSEHDDGIVLSLIRTGAQGQGLASAAMKDLLAYADQYEKTVALTPSPVGSGGLSKTALEKWYRSLGFVRNTGKNADFRFTESMIREPRISGGESLMATFRSQVPEAKATAAMKKVGLPGARFTNDGRLQVIGSGADFTKQLVALGKELGEPYDVARGTFDMMERDAGDYKSALDAFSHPKAVAPVTIPEKIAPADLPTVERGDPIAASESHADRIYASAKPWLDSLSADDRELMRQWGEFGSRDINNYLSGKPILYAQYTERGRVMEAASNLQKLVESAPPLPDGTVLYRAVDATGIDPELAKTYQQVEQASIAQARADLLGGLKEGSPEYQAKIESPEWKARVAQVNAANETARTDALAKWAQQRYPVGRAIRLNEPSELSSLTASSKYAAGFPADPSDVAAALKQQDTPGLVFRIENAKTGAPIWPYAREGEQEVLAPADATYRVKSVEITPMEDATGVAKDHVVVNVEEVPACSGLTAAASAACSDIGVPVPDGVPPAPTLATGNPFPGQPRDVAQAAEENRSAAIAKYAAAHNMTPEAYQAAADQIVKDYVSAHPQIRLRMTQESLESMMRDGRYKSEFELPGVTPEMVTGRAETERRMFGYDRYVDPQNRPVYGYLAGTADEGGEVGEYGEIIVNVNPSVNARATFTMGDSYRQGLLDHLSPTSLSSPGIGSWGGNFDILKAAEDGSLPDVMQYVEVEIHGGLTTADIGGITPDRDLITRRQDAQQSKDAVEALMSLSANYEGEQLVQPPDLQGLPETPSTVDIAKELRGISKRATERTATLDALIHSVAFIEHDADFLGDIGN